MMNSVRLLASILFTLRLCPTTLAFVPSHGKHQKQQSSSLHAKKTVEKTAQEWRQELTPDQYYVLREEGTEPPNSSELNDVKEDGTFICAGCGAPLFQTSTKFDSGTGWPSFYAPVSDSSIALSTDFKLIVPRTEVSCATCKGHLGHVFDDGPPPTGQRFCMNGVAMEFLSEKDNPKLMETVKQQSTTNPYKLQATQILPSLIINGVTGGLFFQAFLNRMEMQGGIESPIDVLPIIPAVYFGVQAVQACERLKET